MAIARRWLILMVMSLLAAVPRASGGALASPPASGAKTPADPTPVRWIAIPAEKIRPRAGLSYVARLELDTAFGDSTGDQRHSRWVLLEDDVPLGPAHARHSEVETQGGGRYSHWTDSVIFSSSDGSDPRTNGRRYVLVESMDDAWHRVHFLAPGAMLMVRRGDRVWWPLGGAFELFPPRFGAKRPDVNPERPRKEGRVLIFDSAGEYGVRAAGRAVRVLVLEDDPQIRSRQIIGFVAANTTGGREDEVPTGPEAVDWSGVIRSHFDRLFQSDGSLDVACARSALIADMLCRAAGLEVRYCGWLGDDPQFAAHTGLEIFNGRRGQWEYYDPHFGVAAKDRADALSLALSLQRLYNRREDAAFTPLVDKITYTELADQFHSCRAALQLWNDRSRRASVVLLLRDTIPTTIQPDEFEETEFISASTGLAQFRARFYESRTAEAKDTPPAR